MLVIVVRIFAAIVLQRGRCRRKNLRSILRRVPVHKHRPDFRPDEMIWAAGAQMRQLRRGMRIDELQDLGNIGETANHALLAGDMATQKRHKFGSNRPPLLVWLVLCAPKWSSTLPGSIALDE